MVPVGRSMSPPFEPDPCLEHAHVTSCTPSNCNLHNVPRALMPCGSLIISLYLCVFLFVCWHELEHSCAREMVNADQTVHQLQRGIFMGVGWGLWGDPEINNAIFKIQTCSPRILSANMQQQQFRKAEGIAYLNS